MVDFLIMCYAAIHKNNVPACVPFVATDTHWFYHLHSDFATLLGNYMNDHGVMESNLNNKTTKNVSTKNLHNCNLPNQNM